MPLRAVLLSEIKKKVQSRPVLFVSERGERTQQLKLRARFIPLESR
jgi:hypothetical protein